MSLFLIIYHNNVEGAHSTQTIIPGNAINNAKFVWFSSQHLISKSYTSQSSPSSICIQLKIPSKNLLNDGWSKKKIMTFDPIIFYLTNSVL